MYLFDIDGTLLLTGGAGSVAINSLFLERYGVVGAMNGVSAGGKTDPMILQECAREHMRRELKQEEIETILNEYIPLLVAEMAIAENFRIMPHVQQCLSFVASSQEFVGIATGNIAAAADAKLRRAGLHEYFHFGGYGCDSAARSELVAKAIERGRALADRSLDAPDFVVVGDTVRDIVAARDCGARVVAVATGHVSREELADAKPDALWDTLAELPGWHAANFALRA